MKLNRMPLIMLIATIFCGGFLEEVRPEESNVSSARWITPWTAAIVMSGGISVLGWKVTTDYNMAEIMGPKSKKLSAQRMGRLSAYASKIMPIFVLCGTGFYEYYDIINSIVKK